MQFSDLGVSQDIVIHLGGESICEPLPIQERVIPLALSGRSLLVSSQTGSGKTLSYLLPLVEQLRAASTQGGVRALIVAPSRELAQQIGSICDPLCRLAALSSTTIVGGVEYEPQREALASNPDIIVATPGRLLDLLEQGAAQIEGLHHLVIDEVDQMLDLGFKEPITNLAKLRGEAAQTLCFSATLPKEVVEVVSTLSPSIEQISIEQPLSVESIEHLGYYVSFEMMDHLLLHLIRREQAEQAIIFTRSRKMADRVVGVLKNNNIEAEAIHSDRSQAAREHILERFRTAQTKILVATDVIARGLDVDSVTHIFNFGLPQSPEQYIHRTGRVGRAGRSGVALSLFTPDERRMVDAICRLMKRHIVIDNQHPYLTSEVSRALSGGRSSVTAASRRSVTASGGRR